MPWNEQRVELCLLGHRGTEHIPACTQIGPNLSSLNERDVLSAELYVRQPVPQCPQGFPRPAERGPVLHNRV